jgi:protein dithiol oxidoreductase (disulfide-forming)
MYSQIKLVVTILFLNLGLGTHLAITAQTNESFVAGVDYQVLNVSIEPKTQDLGALKQIADIEVYYWYGCQPCRESEQAISEYLAMNPHLSLIRVPLTAHVDWRSQAYLQPLMAQLSNQLAVPSELELYQQCLDDCEVFATFQSSLNWLKQTLKLEQLPRIDEAAIWEAEKEARKRAELFSISQVPTIIIREKYKLDANMAKSPQRLVKIINYLLNQ